MKRYQQEEAVDAKSNTSRMATSTRSELKLTSSELVAPQILETLS